MVELFIADIMSKVTDRRAQVLLLQEKEGLRKIIVALGFIETQAIVFALRGVEPGRPLTHDLFGSLASACGFEQRYRPYAARYAGGRHYGTAALRHAVVDQLGGTVLQLYVPV